MNKLTNSSDKNKIIGIGELRFAYILVICNNGMKSFLKIFLKKWQGSFINRGDK